MSSLFELVSGKPIRDNLSRYGDAFVGRRLAMERVGKVLEDDRVAVLVGAPGVGKSRLANEWGWTFLETRPAASAWFVDLTDAATKAEVLAAVGRPLAIRFGAAVDEDEAVSRIADVLAALGPTLVILDNAEHHAPFVARCVDAWLEATEVARFLVTSRRSVGEFPTVDLRSLGNVEAVTLLEDRIRRFRPRFDVGDDTRADLRRLALELDGLPLALELVAPRLRLLSPAQLMERLDRSSGALDAALRRSWEMLDETEQSVLAQTAVFRGGFDVPAAEAVIAVDGGATVLDTIENLVDHSLLRIATTSEFPDETRLDAPLAIREFAGARLEESGDRDDVVARHVAYFVQNGEAWDAGIDTGDERESTRRLVVELPNLMAARGRATGEARVRLGLVLHLALQRGGDFTRQFEIAEETVRGARELDDDGLVGRALLCRARSRRWKNDFEASLEDLEEALEFARLSDDVATEASALRNLAAGSWGRGDLEQTRAYADEALRVSLESGNPVEEVNSRNGLGFLFAHTGELDRAQEELERALALAREMDRAPGLTALVTSSLAALMTLRGRFDQAEFYSTEALASYRELDYVRSVPMELAARAEARCASGKLDAAREDVDEARAIIDRMGFRTLRLRLGHVATLVELLDDNIPAALDEIDQTVRGLGESGDQMLLLGARLYEVVARALLGQLTQAERAWEVVQSLDEGGGRWSNLTQVAEGFLELARANDAEPDDRSAHLSVARAVAEASFEQDAVASSLLTLLSDRLPDDGPRYTLAQDGRAFRLAGAEPVDITRRKALRGILHLLVARRQEEPGEPAVLEEILEAGWPGEVMTHDSGNRRVYVSVKRLRDLGLEELLITAGDGYMLDPNVPVEIVDAL